MATDPGAYFCIVFTNAASEDEQIDAIQCGDHGGDLLANGVAKHLDRKLRIGVVQSSLMQSPHVAADARDRQKARLVIDQIRKLGDIKLHFSHQVEQNTWIYVANARAHDHPTGGRQTHAGVNRFSVFDGSHASAVA